jgi:hypothetical protein
MTLYFLTFIVLTIPKQVLVFFLLSVKYPLDRSTREHISTYSDTINRLAVENNKGDAI